MPGRNENLEPETILRLSEGIGNRVTKVRTGIMHWGKAEMASFLGMSRNRYDRFEAGRVTAKGLTAPFRHDAIDLVRLGQAAGVSLAWLMTGDEGAAGASSSGIPALAVLDFAARVAEEGDPRAAFALGALITELGLQRDFNLLQRQRRERIKKHRKLTEEGES